MITRVFLFVVDGLGVGATDDAADYGDANANTLAHIAEASDGLTLPTLESLGLGHICKVEGVRAVAQPAACFGRLDFRSKRVDSVSGYREIAGCLPDSGEPAFAESFPSEVVAALAQVCGRTVLGAQVSSAAEALNEWGVDHCTSGSPIVWSDGRQTCFLAAHVTTMRPEVLYQHAKQARKVLHDRWNVGRVVAQPLEGSGEELRCGAGRRDFAGEPPGQTMLDNLNRSGQILIGIGRVGDLFGGRGLTRSVIASTWTAALDEANKTFTKVPRGLIFVGLDLVTHDAGQSALALQEFDRRFEDMCGQFRPGDLCILTGDHGRDPKKSHGLPTREYVPLLITGPKLAQGVNLGIRASAADIGQTVVEALRANSLPIGESLLDALRPG